MQRGSMPRTGDGCLHNKLVETVWTVVCKESVLEEFYRRI